MKKCRSCAKPATLHITEIREGVAHELHLCEACASEYLSNPDGTESPEEGVGLKLPDIADEEQNHLAYSTARFSRMTVILI